MSKIIFILMLMSQFIYAKDYEVVDVQKHFFENAVATIYTYSWYYNRSTIRDPSKIKKYEELYYDFILSDRIDIVDGVTDADNIRIVKMSKEFPFLVVEITFNNEGKRYSLYDIRENVTRIAKRIQIISKSKTAQSGFYKDNSGEYFVDILTTKGTPIAKCNSCQTHNVETYKITNDGMKLINTVSYKSYKKD